MLIGSGKQNCTSVTFPCHQLGLCTEHKSASGWGDADCSTKANCSFIDHTTLCCPVVANVRAKSQLPNCKIRLRCCSLTGLIPKGASVCELQRGLRNIKTRRLLQLVWRLFSFHHVSVPPDPSRLTSWWSTTSSWLRRRRSSGTARSWCDAETTCRWPSR